MSRVSSGKPCCRAKRRSAFADEEDVRRALHDAAGKGGGVADIFDGGDGAAAERAAVHDTGVQADRADAVGQAAVADAVDRGVIFDGLSAGEAASSAG